ncbi:alpha/beta hydrolase family protein [Bifidobacterium sp. SO1]|uniref:alpha/beta hydrolase family protein n=1 Tax=Bifidobacterium sp. SO1 TaxID=2809029 RepID=UPI001BDD39F4|nr:alpha/beta hydrolase family protein [Bifidobacterium sp. SO1]MBT1160630.1 hypothetical protein [Bifidobacterium sp. SO1]
MNATITALTALTAPSPLAEPPDPAASSTASPAPLPMPTSSPPIVREDKPLLTERDLPGPLSLNMLISNGSLARLDSSSGYQRSHATTLYGRATILADMVPRNATVCALTAAWLWLGGTFPNTVDVISRSHYRAAAHSRKIRVFNRKSPSEHLIQIGGTRVTTPARTVCDLSLLPTDEPDCGATICDLMTEYRVTADDCLHILDRNPFWPRASAARVLFEDMRRP